MESTVVKIVENRGLRCVKWQRWVNSLEYLLCDCGFLKQMTKPAYRGLLYHPLATQVDADKFAHHFHVIQRFFHRRVTKTIPMLQIIDSQHPLNSNRTTAQLLADSGSRDQSALPMPTTE